MKTTTLSDAKTQSFQYRLAGIWKHFEKLNSEIEKIVNEYGDIWLGVSNNRVHPVMAEESHKKLLLKAQETNKYHTMAALEELFKIKREYLEAVMPSENNKYDLVELTLLEKELSVMTDAQLEKYYEEIWTDNSLSRLVIVELKKRAIAKNGSAEYVNILTRDGYSDDFTKEADELIRFTTAISRDSDNTFCYISNPVTRMTHPIRWATIFNYIRIKNHSGNATGFKPSDLINPQFGLILDQELSTYARRNNLSKIETKLI